MSIQEKYASLPPLAGDVKERLQKIPGLLARHPVQLAYLFGSCARAPEQAADVDLAFFPEPGFDFREFYADLSELLGTDRVDLVELPQAPLWLRRQILETGTCIYERTCGDRLRWESTVWAVLRDAKGRKTFRSKEEPMGINLAFVHDALDELDRVAIELRKYRAPSLPVLETNLSLCWTVERGLLAGLTLLFQMADHILSQHFGCRPETYEGLLRNLRSCRVISQALYAQLRGVGGFRHVLVHEYVRIDLQRVREVLQSAPDVLSLFIQETQAWLNAQQGGIAS